MSLKDFFGTIVDRLKDSAQVGTVFGEPMRLEDRTIVPVAKAAFGFGSGRLLQTDEASPNSTADQGARAAGGTATTPMGVLEITSQGTRFVPIPDNNPAKVVAAFAAGLILGAVLVVRGRRSRTELPE